MEKGVFSIAIGKPFFCPFCGTQTIPPYVEEKTAEFQKCNHLLYIGTTEGGFEYLNQDFESRITEEMDEEELMDLDINNAIHFSLCDLPPSSFGVFVGYKS